MTTVPEQAPHPTLPAPGLPTVGIAAIFKNEGPYLLEWIAACRLAGAHLICIADNNSTDGSTTLLAELHRQGLIVHIPFPSEEGKPPQLSAYREIMSRHGQAVDWMAFIDADEFFRFDPPTLTLPALVDALGQAPDVGAIAINWAIYGSGHQAGYEDAPVAARFRWRAEPSVIDNHHYKSLVRTRAYANTHGTPHMFSLQNGFRYVLADGTPLLHHPDRGVGLSDRVVWSPVRLDHYVLKSREEFDAKKRPNGSATTPGRVKGDAYFFHHDRNEVEDPASGDHLARLQKEIVKLKSILPRHLLDAVAFRQGAPRPRVDEPPLVGHVDQVTLDARRLSVSGWSPLISTAESPALLIEWPGGSAISSTLVKRERPDVARRFPSAGLHCGFLAEFALPHDALLAADLDTSTFHAVDGAQKAKLSGSGHAQWRYTGPNRPQQAAANSTPDQPAMPAACIELLTSALGASRVYLEYGSGGSTLLAARSPAEHIVSVESDPAWLKGVLDKAFAIKGAKDRLHPMHVDIGPTKALGYPVDDSHWKNYWQYPLSPWAKCQQMGLAPDLVLIDGRFRLACFLATLLNAPAGCRVLFDDYTDRPHYHGAAALLKPLTEVDRMAVFVVPPVRPEPAQITHALAAAMGDPR
ncbi:glycosyltransferase family 2 protein [Hydrogenophaga sp.]|uniref:glycosyltransferase family 2 protein n=1 Tax=Hydrogenophaga sp. TaxID=1904254 RepID=UPI0035B0C568